MSRELQPHVALVLAETALQLKACESLGSDFAFGLSIKVLEGFYICRIDKDFTSVLQDL